jgi:hypothetical protein
MRTILTFLIAMTLVGCNNTTYQQYPDEDNDFVRGLKHFNESNK